MATRMKQDVKTKTDQRHEDGKMMTVLLETVEFKRYLEILSSLRQDAMYMVLAVDSESVKHRERLRTLDEVIGIPTDLIKRARQAQEEE